MGIGTSIFLFAIGAILRFAVTVHTTGLNLHAVGVILMIVGVVGALLSLAFWSSWGGFNAGPRGVYQDRDVVVQRPAADVVVDDVVVDDVVVERPARRSRRRAVVVERETRR